MADCNHDCSSCAAASGCDEKPVDMRVPGNKYSNVKRVIGVISGKGGVGKSSVTSLLAVASAKKGKKVAILDADITGPSIPAAFGVTERPMGTEEEMIIPVTTSTGIEIMSTNLLLPEATDPVVWRGPLLGGVIEQFWSEVIWGDIDVMYVDMPPGTGDVALTVFQSLPIDGIVIVSSPQTLVAMIVEKAVKMAAMMDIPVLGLVENMAYFKCPDCGSEHYIFGESHLDEIAASMGIEKTVQLPLDAEIAAYCDAGQIEKKDPGEITKLEEMINS
ncbi:MAG: Mrp/NBP35 family ATP-binding protein [Eubacterium sp.]|nr:Mrp/NBP35 family ATP-binding protein [Eubacterium sp.]